jgi:hypothetical protein
VTRDELRRYDGASVAVLFMMRDGPAEAWSRTLRLDWRDEQLWLGDEDGNGWFLDEESFERIRSIDDDLRETLGRHADGASLFFGVNVGTMPEDRSSITMTGLQIPRSSPG